MGPPKLSFTSFSFIAFKASNKKLPSSDTLTPASPLIDLMLCVSSIFPNSDELEDILNLLLSRISVGGSDLFYHFHSNIERNWKLSAMTENM
jgi:hypothetical protein